MSKIITSKYLIICLAILLILMVAELFYLIALFRQNRVLIDENNLLTKQVKDFELLVASTTQDWQMELKRNDQLAEQISGLATSVQALDKLSKTDKELLKKYSKVYFLSEHYTPERLATITPEFLYPERENLRIHSAVQNYLEQMLREASSSNHQILIVSAYRSFSEQASLKNGYKINYGSGANKFSADQGYSEHQLGTTVDLSLATLGPTTLNFGETTAYRWLIDNAHRFGFVLSYPPNNLYYQYEPWHWRFVGVALATKLKQEEKYFYNYPQRLIDSYLASIFD